SQGAPDASDRRPYPTRRSSDLKAGPVIGGANSRVARVRVHHVNVHRTFGWLEHLLELGLQVVACPLAVGLDLDRQLHVALLEPRSEEHTSELQSRFDLVCRLLL